MYLLVYVSSAMKLMSDKELVDILVTSRKNNEVKEITGILLYKEGNFMQFLEGSKEVVLGLLARIKSDPRHHGLIVLFQEEHDRREFSEWSMGFKKLDSETLNEVPGYSDFLNLPLTSEQFLMNPSRTLQLLLSFKKIVH